MANIIDEPDGATPLDVDELAGLKQKHVTTRGQLNALEQANISTGIRWLDRKQTKNKITEQWLKELHRQLFGKVWNWAGKFRLTEKNIGIDPAEISVSLRMLLDDVQFWIDNGTYSPIEATARFHHRLVQIHLFPNGNGRHARIAADVLLTEHFNRAPIDWSKGQDIQENNSRRREYISALRAADGEDYRPLLIFMGEPENSPEQANIS